MSEQLHRLVLSLSEEDLDSIPEGPRRELIFFLREIYSLEGSK